MKLPSLRHIASGSSAALHRFPLVLLSAAVAVVTALLLIELDPDSAQLMSRYYALLLVSLLGLPLFLALKLTGEKMDWTRPVQIAADVCGAAFLAFYYFMLPDDFDGAPTEFLFRYALFLLAAHLLVAVGPYWGRGEMSSFWHYNKTLFLRFLTAVLFSWVLYVGLTIAMVSTDELLGVDIDPERYFQLFVVIAGIFNTWFFLGGIPDLATGPPADREYPKGLKIFTQYILIPLVVIYVIILYLYTGKVIVEWSWPEGLVAYLVLTFSVAGIFALLLLHPIQEKVENRWIKTFSRSYFLFLVPLVILLLLAIWRRIWEYSFTVNRYFVLVLGLWLAGIVIYFIASRAKNIKVIPASLAVLAILISFGPWGAFSVSERSQANRLEQYLQQHDILRDGLVHEAAAPVPAEDRAEISSILRYLNSTHGVERLQPWFEENLSALSGDSLTLNRSEIPGYLSDRMGIEYVDRWGGTEVPGYQRQFLAEEREIIPVGDFTWLIRYRYEGYMSDSKTVSVGDSTLTITSDPGSSTITIHTESGAEDSLRIDLNPLIGQLGSRYSNDTYSIPPEEMTVAATGGGWSVRFHLTSLTVRRQEGQSVFLGFEGDLLLRTGDSNNP